MTSKGRSRILVIDDEPMLRNLIPRLLPECDVVVVGSAAAGLEQCQNEDFDAIVCDLMMPGKTGLDVHEQLLADRPELAARMIILTGGARELALQQRVEDTGLPLVRKPFEKSDLQAAISVASRRGRDQTDG